MRSAGRARCGRRGLAWARIAACVMGWPAMAAPAFDAHEPAEPREADATSAAFTSGEGRWIGAAREGPAPFSDALDPATTRAPRLLRLGELDTAALAREDELAGEVGPLRIGVGRAVGATLADGEWSRDARGDWVWRLEIASPGAVGVRLHLCGLDLPPGVEAMVCEATALPGRAPAAAGPWRERGPTGNGEWWSPTMFGERARVEVRAPGWLTPDAIPRDALRIDGVQHIYRGRVTGAGAQAGAGPEPPEALPCHLDASCFPQWAGIARAVGRLAYIRNGMSFLCSGTLLNTVAGDLTPYFLTANHCVSTTGEAETSEVYWLYQTAECNGAPPELALAPRSEVMTLVRAGAASDYSLNIVEGALPTGVAWSGWDAGQIPVSEASLAIHHPGGSYRRMSFGFKASSAVCQGSAFLGIGWLAGQIESGSSGSGVFRAGSGALYGQLLGSCQALTCENPSAVYGAFWRTHQSVQMNLAAGSDDALEPNDSCVAAHALAPGMHAGLIVKSVDEDWYSLVVPPGRRVVVAASHTHAWGDIDLELLEACGGAAVASASTASDLESLAWWNTGASAAVVLLRVHLASDTRNQYTLTVSETGACPGDANGDGAVNFVDLNIVLTDYGQSGAPGALAGDVNGDGVVDFLDLNIVLAFFGQTC